jgi:DNA-binding protein YbaB
MKNMQQFMQQAQKMQQQIEAAQTKLGDHLVTGQSGGGLVKITKNG